MTSAWSALLGFAIGLISPASATPWRLAEAVKLPSEFTNQESGYFSIVAGKDGTLYIGTAKYGVNAWLLAVDPQGNAITPVLDVHRTIGSNAVGFAAQAKIHTRNNVDAQGRIWCGSKQGYPEKGEERSAYRGGYVLCHDPGTKTNTHYGVPKVGHGVISVMPDSERGLVYVSTCSDTRPLDQTHFLVLDLRTRTYTDLGDMEHAYAFIVLDHRGRALHPRRGGRIARYDPTSKRLETLNAELLDGPLPESFRRDGAILNWETSPDRKTLYAVEMSTNGLYAFDLTSDGEALRGRFLGKLLASSERTDCRALCVGSDGTVWAAVLDMKGQEGPQLHLVGRRPQSALPCDFGPIGVANPTYVQLTDANGRLKPWHHTLRRSKDGTLTPWQPMGICADRGMVYIVTIAPFTLLKLKEPQ